MRKTMIAGTIASALCLLPWSTQAITIPPPGVCPGGTEALEMVERQVKTSFPRFIVTVDPVTEMDRYGAWRDWREGVCVYRVLTRLSVDAPSGGGRSVIVDGFVGVRDGRFVEVPQAWVEQIERERRD